MQRTRIQRGGPIAMSPPVANKFGSSDGEKPGPMAGGRRGKRWIGTLEEYPTKKAAENAARSFRLNPADRGSATLVQITMRELVDHFSEHEQVDKGEEGRAYSTRDRCESFLNCWILLRWGKTAIDQIRTVAVEEWLRSIPRANGPNPKSAIP